VATEGHEEEEEEEEEEFAGRRRPIMANASNLGRAWIVRP